MSVFNASKPKPKTELEVVASGNLAIGAHSPNGHKPVIAMSNIVKRYQMGEHTVHALRSVDLMVERGDYVAIMGASGSGKSTLMNIIGCLDIPTSGRYHLDGVDVRLLDESALIKGSQSKNWLHLSEFQFDPSHQRCGQCGATAGLWRFESQGSSRPGVGCVGRCWVE